jgi:hypothetical protein
MTCISKFSGMLVALAAATSVAQAADVDWKMYGFATVREEGEVCFYDAKGVARAADGNVRVWTKCLSRKEIDNIDIEHDFGGQILKNTAQKMLHSYLPPFAHVKELNFDQIMVFAQYEETANISHIQPATRIFYELNCSQKMLRELSIELSVNGQYGFRNTPAEWKYISPQTNGTSLQKILCPMQ